MWQSILSFIGTLPPYAEWVLAPCLLVLFVFVAHIVFEVFATFMQVFGYKGGRS